MCNKFIVIGKVIQQLENNKNLQPITNKTNLYSLQSNNHEMYNHEQITENVQRSITMSKLQKTFRFQTCFIFCLIPVALLTFLFFKNLC